MKRVVALGGAALCLASCGAGSSSQGSFVGAASNAAVLIQWTRNGSQLTGELEQALLQGGGSSGQESVSDQSIAFTGTVSGSSVTLSLNQGLGSTTNLTGTLNGGELDFNYPGQGGGLITIPMRSGTASDYNADLSHLQGQAGQANAQTAATQAAQQRASSVARDAQAVVNDLSTLQSAISNATGTSSVGADLAQMRKDLGQTLTDEQHVLGEQAQTDSSTLCSDADTVSSDADTVQSDADTIQGDQDSGGGDTTDIATAVTQVKQDAATLDADRSNDPADVPADAPSDGQIAAAIKAAQMKISG